MDKKLKEGLIAPDFNYIRLDGHEANFYKDIEGQLCYLIFLRYYGCTVCQYIIRNLSDNYNKFLEKNINIFVVLQSEPSIINQAIQEDRISVNIIPDVEQAIYKLYDVKPAKNKAGLASLRTIEIMKKAKKIKLIHGEYEGNELQLPATFLIDQDKVLRYVKYGSGAGDVPEAKELININKDLP